MTSHTPANTYTRFIHPTQGRWKIRLLSLLLRLSVKSRHGLHIDIPKLRQQFDQLNQQAGKALPSGVHCQGEVCNGVSAQWLSPEGHRSNRVLLYLHGGAFVAYTPDAYAAMVASWCQSLKTRGLMVDYHLAPEHPYPRALEDCLAAYQWLLEKGFKARDIVLAGDSAGGNLAMAVLQHLKAANQPLPSCAVLLSPFLDFTLSGYSTLENAAKDPVFTLPFTVGIRNFYAPPQTYSLPSVSPLFGDFAGLPPLLFQVGSTEMIRDDATRAAARADAAGVSVRLEIWQRLPHVFQLMASLPQTRMAAQHIYNFINEHTDWAS